MRKKYIILTGLILALSTAIFLFFYSQQKSNIILGFTIKEYLPQSSSHTSGPYFIITGHTKHEYSCLMNINSNTDIEDNLIKVELKGDIDNISVGDDGPFTNCPMAIGPASLTERLDITEGEYLLELYLKPKTDKYKVVVTPESVQLSKIKTSFSELTKSKTNRSPLNIIAAHCFRYKYGCETGETPNEVCPIFFSEIAKVATPIEDESLAEGTVVSCSKKSYKEGKCQLYRYDGELEKLEEIYDASNHYEVEHGYIAECRGDRLYRKRIDTARGPTFSQYKCTPNENGGETCINTER